MTEQRQPWAKWYWSDWRADVPLRMCSYAARGLWADLLSLMAESSRYGFLLINGVQPTVTQLTALLGGAERDVKKYLAELGNAGVFSRTGDLAPLLTAPPDHITALIPAEIGKGVILSRRMVRDKAKSSANQSNGGLGGNPNIRRGTVPKEDRVRPYKRSDSPQKTLRIFNRTGGRCWWCTAELNFEPQGDSPDNFHVDHLVPICDGGTNDEANLVPSCAACNHDRARNINPTASPESGRRRPTPTSDNNRVAVGNASDTKAQKLEARDQKESEGQIPSPVAGASDPPTAPPGQPKRAPLSGAELAKLLRGNGKELSADDKKDIWFQRVIGIAKEELDAAAFTRWMLAVDAEEPWAKRETERLSRILREQQARENATIMDTEQGR